MYALGNQLFWIGPFKSQGEADCAARKACSEGEFDAWSQEVYLVTPDHRFVEYSTDELEGGEKEPEGEEEGEPEEGDYVTVDHRSFRVGSRTLVLPDGLSTGEMWAALDADMAGEGFWPGVWFLSDHGNYHLMVRGV